MARIIGSSDIRKQACVIELELDRPCSAKFRIKSEYLGAIDPTNS
jgi:hypothetical protein